MTTRTVSVVLTGTAAPYISATQQAARATQVAARQIETSMRAATNSSQAAFQGMARAAETQGARAATSMNRAASATESQMRRTGASGAASLNQVGAGAAQAAASVGAVDRAATATGAQLSQLGTRGAAAANQVAGSSGQLAASLGTVNQAATVTSSQLSRLGTGGSAAVNLVTGSSAQAAAGMATVASAATAAAATTARQFTGAGGAVTRVSAAARAAAAADAGRLASAWSSAAAAIGGGMRFAASTVGTSMVDIANGSEKSLKAARAASLGLVAVFALAAAAAARFEKAMSEVRAVTGGSADEMKGLSAAALAAGQATVYSATQAANAEAELARAGISTADIIGGALKGSLDLAASGQLDLGESAIISAQAMNAFKLSGKDVGHIADVISAGAGKSATDVHHLGMAFRQAALLASQTGLSLEETVGTLSLFAQNALTGSDAGTSLKVMLQRLVPQSNEAAAAMDAIGFSAYDASGNFIGLSALSAQMKQSFSQLTPEARNAAMATIFGSDAVRAATILYEAGSEGVDKWVQSVNDSGYATRVAATMTDNLAGDLERLKGSLETALISSGSSANKVLRDMAQVLTSVVNWYGQLSPQVQSSVTIMTGLVGVVGLVGTSLLLMLPRIMAVRAELIALGVTAARVRASMLALGGVGVIVATIAAISWGVERMTERFRDAPPNVTALTNALVDFSRKGQATGELSKQFGKNLDGIGEAAARLAHPGTLDRIGDSLYSITHFGSQDEGLQKARDQIKSLDQALSSLVQSGSSDVAANMFGRMSVEAEKQGTSTEKLKTLLPQYSEALTATDTQTKLAAGSQNQFSDAMKITAHEMADTRSQAEKLKDALSLLNGVAISAAEKEIAFRASLKDLTDAVKENGYSLDVTTEKGRAVKGAFLDAASAALAHAEATAQQQDSVAAGNAVLEQDIAILRRQMEQAHFSTEAIDLLLSSYAKLPKNVETKVGAPGATQSTAELEALRLKIAAVPAGKSITVQAPTAGAIAELQRLGYKVETLPDGRVTISVPTAGAVQALDSLQSRIWALQGKTITITTNLRTTGSPYPESGGRSNREANGGYIRGYASGGNVQWMPSGGPVFGPGTSTSDSVPTWLSTGEYVIKASSVRRYGLSMLDQLNAGHMPAQGYMARPAGRFGGGSAGGQTVQQVTKHYTINLYGSKQSSAEQAADIQRHLAFTT